ncbi:hypothetical protein LCGC14_1575370 [marine sediment metagenome]|uniref:Uncharacterized protein n=1 Tax=marine sediment metagenome TaxID=412755 RepID=A0A0F9KZE5_9ZZZZ
MDEDCEPVIAQRTTWMAAMELATRTDSSLAEKIGGVHVQVADFETQPFLAMRAKIMLAVQGGLERETAEKLTSGEKSTDTDIEIELTAAELVYLDMAVRVADFKGALSFKKALWRAIAVILERKP